VLPVALDHPHAHHNRADDEQDAQELAARRIIDPCGHHAGDADRDGQDGNNSFANSSSISAFRRSCQSGGAPHLRAAVRGGHAVPYRQPSG